MKTITAIMVVAVGAILTFAINAHPGFISPQIVGLVLMLTGITGLCLNQRGTGLLDRQLVMLRHLLGQDASAISGRRVPLDELLHDEPSYEQSDKQPSYKQSDEQPGHQQPGYDQPGYEQSDEQPGHQQPGYDQPGYEQSAQPGHEQPGHDRRESVGTAAWPSQSSHHSPPSEVSIDDTPTSPDIWGGGRFPRHRIPEGIGAGRTAR